VSVSLKAFESRAVNTAVFVYKASPRHKPNTRGGAVNNAVTLNRSEKEEKQKRSNGNKKRTASSLLTAQQS
jgi:hypothetical protein